MTVSECSVNRPPSLYHVTLGVGRPEVRQCNRKLSPVFRTRTCRSRDSTKRTRAFRAVCTSQFFWPNLAMSGNNRFSAFFSSLYHVVQESVGCTDFHPWHFQNSRWRPRWLPFHESGHISATDHPIYFMFGSRVAFSGSADRMALFLIELQDTTRLVTLPTCCS